ncbi:MAG: TonB family protein [Sphingomonadales bacterium]|nr:MAG: TonB family protein [Sphingomonadales bacterium]
MPAVDYEGADSVNNRSVIRFLVAGMVALIVATPAFADIKAYNAAITSGDVKQAAVEAKGVWATWNQARPDTALIAREFGYITYVAGDFAATRDFGLFLQTKGPTLATPDDQPAVSAVVLAAANFRLKADGRTRSELFKVLQQRQATPNIDRLSMLAAEALYVHDLDKGEYRNTAESAEIAFDLISRDRGALTVRSLNARSISAISRFVSKRGRNDFFPIADAHDAIIDALNVTSDPAQRDDLIDLKFFLQAWAHSAEAYLYAAGQISAVSAQRFESRELKTPDHAIFPISTSADIRCDMDFEKNTLKYPRSAAFQGLVGTVIVKMDVNHEGRITQSQVLASVPAEGFAESVMKFLDTARFVRTKDAEPGCMMFAPAMIYTFSFNIE